MGKKKVHTFYWWEGSREGGYSDDLVCKKTKQNETGIQCNEFTGY